VRRNGKRHACETSCSANAALILVAVVLALAAAALHATWNVMVKVSGNPMGTFQRATGLAALTITPIVLLVWLLDGRPGFTAAAAGLATISALLELLYVWLLSTAYQRGELSVVYPIARGSAPLLAVIFGLALLGERLSTPQLIGVALLLVGILAVTLPATSGKAALPALLTGVCIAVYTAVDRVGVRQSTPPWLYGWLLVTLLAIALQFTSWIGARRARRGSSDPPPVRLPVAAVIGAFIWAGYFLVLFALSIAPLSVVAPVRETAVVGVAVWGVWKLRERQAAGLKLLGAGATVAGVALVAL
jgi:drug/metabolite transporter (DMT)-like permease